MVVITVVVVVVVAVVATALLDRYFVNMGVAEVPEGVDVGDLIGLGLFSVPIATYLYIVYKQHKMLNRNTARVQILSTRTVIFLPTYALLVMLTLIFPGLAAAFDLPIALAEGID